MLQTTLTSLLMLLCSQPLLASETINSDHGSFELHHVSTFDDQEKFALIELSGNTNITDRDGFFSAALLVHAHNTGLIVRFNEPNVQGWVSYATLKPKCVAALRHLSRTIAASVNPRDAHMRKKDLPSKLERLLAGAPSLADEEWFAQVASALSPYLSRFKYSLDSVKVQMPRSRNAHDLDIGNYRRDELFRRESSIDNVSVSAFHFNFPSHQ